MRIFYFLMLNCFLSITAAFAFSPASIELEYSQEDQNLHVVVKHIALKSRKDFIRRVFITKNNEEPQKFVFTSQDNPDELVLDVPLELAPGDTVKALAICNDAGRKETALTIVEEKNEEQEQK